MDNELQIRIARALWDRAQRANEAIGIPFRTWDNAPLPSRNALLDYAGVVVTALGLEEKRRVRCVGGTETENFCVEERSWTTPWEVVEEKHSEHQKIQVNPLSVRDRLGAS